MPGLTFLHPLLLWGLVGIGLPIVIHLIGKRRAPTVRFAAFDFLVAVNKRLARRERLRQILLLACRVLALAAVTLAVARPMRHRPVAAPEAARRLLVVLDASRSMGYVKDGATLLERAKGKAKDALSHLLPGDAASVIIAGKEVRAVTSTPTVDHAALRAAIDAVQTPEGVADLGAAIEQGLAQLGSSGAGATLLVVTDLSANSFEGLRPTAVDPPPEVRLIDAAARDNPGPLGNLGVAGLRIEHTGDSANDRRFVLTVKNFGNTPISGRTLELVVGERVVLRGFVDVGPKSTAEKVVTHTFDGPGVYSGTLRLLTEPGDGYADDDGARFVTEVVPGVRVLAVNGDPRTTPYEDELFFLERALDAIPKADPPIELRIVTLDELPEAELSGFQVIVLANVAGLVDTELQRLRVFVEKGGGLLFCLGDKVQFEEANTVFGNLLPFPLRDLQRVADENAGTPPVGIGDVDWDHPILAGLGSAAEQALRESKTGKYFNLGVGAGLKVRPILRFDNGAPALVERRDGAGRVMLWATSIDVDFSDLPLRAAFPAVLQRTVRYLARAVELGHSADVREGGAVDIPAPTGVHGIALISPTGERRAILLDEGSTHARFAELTPAGLHRVEVLRDGWSPEPRLDVAVNVPLDESDFTPVSAEQISEALGHGGSSGPVSVLVGEGEESDPFATRGLAAYALAVLCLLFIGESLLASRG